MSEHIFIRNSALSEVSFLPKFFLQIFSIFSSSYFFLIRIERFSDKGEIEDAMIMARKGLGD